MAKNTVKFEGCLAADTRKIINDNFEDISVSSTQLDATANTTLANVVGLVTDTLQPGTYKFRIALSSTANAAGGLKVAFKFGTASMLTSIEAEAKAFTASAVAVARASTATDQASLLASTSAVICAEIEGTFVVATAGTLQLQAAQNASNGTATSVYVGSSMTVVKVG